MKPLNGATFRVTSDHVSVWTLVAGTELLLFITWGILFVTWEILFWTFYWRMFPLPIILGLLFPLLPGSRLWSLSFCSGWSQGIKIIFTVIEIVSQACFLIDRKMLLEVYWFFTGMQRFYILLVHTNLGWSQFSTGFELCMVVPIWVCWNSVRKVIF